MANFQISTQHTLQEEGGYQANLSDNGNWLCDNLKWVQGKAGSYHCTDGSSPVLVGTNKGISAPVHANFVGSKITAADQKALSRETALKIYKHNIWDRIKGDYIDDQAVATIFFDASVIAYYRTAAGIMQHTLNNIGHQLKVDGIIGPNTLNAINNTNPAVLHDRFKKSIKAHFESVVANDPGKGEFLEGWFDRFNRYPDLTANPAYTEAIPTISANRPSIATTTQVALEGMTITFADKVPMGRSFFHQNKWVVKTGLLAIAALVLWMGARSIWKLKFAPA